VTLPTLPTTVVDREPEPAAQALQPGDIEPPPPRPTPAMRFAAGKHPTEI
jgi:hypothetical protein